MFQMKGLYRLRFARKTSTPLAFENWFYKFWKIRDV